MLRPCSCLPKGGPQPLLSIVTCTSISRPDPTYCCSFIKGEYGDPTGSEPGCRTGLFYFTALLLFSKSGLQPVYSSAELQKIKVFHEEHKDFVDLPVFSSLGPKSASWESKEKLPWLMSAMGNGGFNENTAKGIND